MRSWTYLAPDSIRGGCCGACNRGPSFTEKSEGGPVASGSYDRSASGTRVRDCSPSSGQKPGVVAAMPRSPLLRSLRLVQTTACLFFATLIIVSLLISKGACAMHQGRRHLLATPAATEATQHSRGRHLLETSKEPAPKCRFTFTRVREEKDQCAFGCCKCVQVAEIEVYGSDPAGHSVRLNVSGLYAF